MNLATPSQNATCRKRMPEINRSERSTNKNAEEATERT